MQCITTHYVMEDVDYRHHTNLSVSPYTTLPPQRGVLLTNCIALLSVSRALLMMLSLI